MAKSIYIPQDIIDNVITAVGEDTRLLKQCSLVSTSFLYPSRKRLFSKLSIKSDQTCRGIHQFLIENPVVQSFVRTITLTEVTNGWGSKFPEWMNGTSLLAILRLPFGCLESFSIIVSRENWTLTGLTPTSWDWNSSSSELKDAVSNIIHSSTLKYFFLSGITRVPITFFNHMVHLTTLELRSISLYDFGDDNSSSSLTEAASNEVVSHSAIDRCVWRIGREHAGYYNTIESTFLPYMCHLRFLEIYVCLDSKSMRNFTILSLLMSSLCTRLTSPATLEHLELNIRYHRSFFEFDSNAFYDNLRDADVWSHLNAITTHPTGSRLQRVDVNISCSFHYRDERNVDIFSEAVLDNLPLLRSKGILFVKAARNWGCRI